VNSEVILAKSMLARCCPTPLLNPMPTKNAHSAIILHVVSEKDPLKGDEDSIGALVTKSGATPTWE
jgi:hypothetical protein